MPGLFKSVECIISGIKCDYCDYRKDDVNFKEYPEYINKECPKCGHNLLTEQDYNKCRYYLGGLFLYNVIVFPVHFVKYVFSKKYRESNTSEHIRM